jgi:predicted nuclease of predicted toxin-antitoxin system
VDEAFVLLLDQNVPYGVIEWLRNARPSWKVIHASEVGLDVAPDSVVYAWAQEYGAAVVTFDEDFADRRSFPVGDHFGIVRLRVWPTTFEETTSALRRLLDEVDESELRGALVIVDRSSIRLRPRRPKT